MVEALKNKNNQLEELALNIRNLSEHWLNSNAEDSLTSIMLSTNSEGIRRLRGYVRDEVPEDTTSLKNNAFVGIAFFENQLVAEIHFPFDNDTITSFTTINLNTWIVSGYNLTDARFAGRPFQYLNLDPFEQLKKLNEFAEYFQRLTFFAIPYETKYLDDIEKLKVLKGPFWDIFQIKPYVFETAVLR
jgi:hypothetical protein